MESKEGSSAEGPKLLKRSRGRNQLKAMASSWLTQEAMWLFYPASQYGLAYGILHLPPITTFTNAYLWEGMHDDRDDSLTSRQSTTRFSELEQQDRQVKQVTIYCAGNVSLGVCGKCHLLLDS